MFAIIIFFVLLLLQRFDVGFTISSDTIAQFRCCKCDPYPNDCCIGSLILPYIIITSAYCAENCKAVVLGKTRNASIIRFYKNPYYRNYVFTGSRSLIKRNDVALVHVTDDPNTERPYLKLSALQVGVLDGLKGLFPVFENLRPKLLRTMIQECRPGTSMSSMGYVICTVNKYLNLSSPCQQQQGVPLLIEGKIIGLSGFVDKIMCINEQRYFMAIGPALSWIRSVVQNVSQHQDNSKAVLRGRHPSFIKNIVKKNNVVLDRNMRTNTDLLQPDPHNRFQEATTTSVIPETKNPVNEDQDTSIDAETSEQQDANNLLDAINMSQMESPINSSSEIEMTEITSSTFSTTNVFDFLSHVGYRSHNGNNFEYFYRKSLQNVSSTVT